MAFLDETGLAELWSINKRWGLSDTAKSLFGLDDNASSSDAFSWLGHYNTHWWSILHGQAGYGYEEVRTLANTANAGSSVSLSANDVVSQTLYYSTSVSVDQENGTVSLVNPKSMVVKGGSTYTAPEQCLKDIVTLAPVYIKNLYDDPSTIYYIPAGATYNRYSNKGATFHVLQYSDGYGMALNNSTTCTNPAYVVTSKIYSIPAGETTYVHSTDRNAYPDSGTVSGLTYQYLGVPFEKFPTMPRIETGSYAGTGVSGASNKNSLTFGFVPKLVVIIPANLQLSTIPLVYIDGAVGINNNLHFQFTLSGTTLTWFTTASGVDKQFNTSGTKYLYIAIGH